MNAFKAAQAVGTKPATTSRRRVALTGPAEGATFKAPVNITLEAAAADSDGSIQQVTFFANGAPIGSDTTSSVRRHVGERRAGQLHADRRGAGRSVRDDDVGAACTSLWRTTRRRPWRSRSPAEGAIVHVAGGSSRSKRARPTATARCSKVTFFANGVVDRHRHDVAPYSVTWKPAARHARADGDRDRQRGRHRDVAAGQRRRESHSGPHQRGARSSNGGVATASSTLGAELSGVRRDQRRSQGPATGAAAAAGTTARRTPGRTGSRWRSPGLKLIEEVNVFSMQDNYTAPIEPTPTMTFRCSGLRALRSAVLGRRGVAARAGRRGHEQQPGVAQSRVRADRHDEDPRASSRRR